jgi:flavocytochrome c
MSSNMAPHREIVIVGSGLAGLTASLTALRHLPPSSAIKIHMLERAPKPGGNSIKASSGINGAGTRFQSLSQDPTTVPDTPDLFYADTVRSAGRRLTSSPHQPQRETLIRTLVERSKSAVEFLADDLGVDLSVVARLGGHSVARTHRGGGKLPPGAAIVTTLLTKLNEHPNFILETDADVTDLVTEEADGDGLPVVQGVTYKHANPQTKAEEGEKQILGPVVFTTGGFAGDTHGLLQRHRPDLAGLPSTNDARPSSHGILTAAGAELVDMDAVQIHPTGFVDPASPQAMVKFLAAEMLRGEGGILLSGGRRFVNELETREVVSGKIMGGLEPVVAEEKDGLRQWDVQLLLDPGATQAAGSHVGFYLFKGLMKKVKIRDLDELTRRAVEEYAKVVRGEVKDELGRTSFGHWSLGLDGKIDPDAEVAVGSVTPITHFTMGGALINEQGQVLASKRGEPSVKKPIQGLWAAGEITGGIHGDNRLGGSSLLECVVFGQIIGQEAAKAAQET